MLTLIPQTVDGEPLTLKKLGELIKKPREGNATKLLVDGRIIPNQTSYWVLMTKDVLPDTCNYTYHDQRGSVNVQNYDAPTVLEATVSILMEYVESGTRLFCKPTRCADNEYAQGYYQAMVGYHYMFGEGEGLKVEGHNSFLCYPWLGLAAARRL